MPLGMTSGPETARLNRHDEVDFMYVCVYFPLTGARQALTSSLSTVIRKPGTPGNPPEQPQMPPQLHRHGCTPHMRIAPVMTSGTFPGPYSWNLAPTDALMPPTPCTTMYQHALALHHVPRPFITCPSPSSHAPALRHAPQPHWTCHAPHPLLHVHGLRYWHAPMHVSPTITAPAPSDIPRPLQMHAAHSRHVPHAPHMPQLQPQPHTCTTAFFDMF